MPEGISERQENAQVDSNSSSVNFLEESVVLVSAADSRYAMPLAVMLSSAIRGLSQGANLDIYILDGGLRRRQRRRIDKTLGNTRSSITYICPPTDVLAGVPVFGHVSLSTYFRLLMPDVLPISVHKAIYVDADCVVTGDLLELWRESINGFPLAAAPAVAPESIAPEELRNVCRNTDRLGAGVLVLDLDLWRREALSSRIVKYLVENHDKVEFWDQDGINAILKGRWRRLDIRWNYRIDCATIPDRSSRGMEDGVRQGNEEAAIVHYASALKPWDYYAEHPLKSVFFKQLDETSWKGWRPKPPLRALLNRHYWGGKVRRMRIVGPILNRILPARPSRAHVGAIT